jgi:hypothetical protein
MTGRRSLRDEADLPDGQIHRVQPRAARPGVGDGRQDEQQEPAERDDLQERATVEGQD